MPNHAGQTNLFPIHGLQLSGAQAPFNASIYSNILQPPPPPPPSAPNSQNLAEQWYYEDPKKNIQGPFSPKEMYNWYRAGFFSPSLMVRRACDPVMRPLGSYGPVVPFAQMVIEILYTLTNLFVWLGYKFIACCRIYYPSRLNPTIKALTNQCLIHSKEWD